MQTEVKLHLDKRISKRSIFHMKIKPTRNKNASALAIAAAASVGLILRGRALLLLLASSLSLFYCFFSFRPALALLFLR